jgi:hypothetical protein
MIPMNPVASHRSGATALIDIAAMPAPITIAMASAVTVSWSVTTVASRKSGAVSATCSKKFTGQEMSWPNHFSLTSAYVPSSLIVASAAFRSSRSPLFPSLTANAGSSE